MIPLGAFVKCLLSAMSRKAKFKKGVVQLKEQISAQFIQVFKGLFLEKSNYKMHGHTIFGLSENIAGSVSSHRKYTCH